MTASPRSTPGAIRSPNWASARSSSTTRRSRRSWATSGDRHHNMHWYQPHAFVDYMDSNNVRRVCLPSLKMMRFRTGVALRHSPRAHRRARPGASRSVRRTRGNQPDRRHGGGAGARTRGRRVTASRGARPPVRVRDCNQRARVVAVLCQVRRARRAGHLPGRHSAEFMPSACGKPLLLDDIAIWFPELRLVGGHTGWPWTEELIAMAWKHPNVYIAVSGHSPQYWDPSSSSSSTPAGGASARSCGGPTIR